MTKKATKRALLSSALALVVCISMLIGTTYAWFTDSVTSTNNIIKSGNLDVVLEYKTDWSDDWTTVENNKPIFKEGVLYEPGYTEVVYLRVSNAGTLALKYNLMVDIVDEVGATNVAGETFKLSDYLMIGSYVQDEYNGPFNYADILMPTMFGDRENAIKNVKLAKLSEADSVINADAPILAGDDTAQVIVLVINMPETVGNEANYRGTAPEINLGITLLATQYIQENDSFGNDYDKDAVYADAYATDANSLADALTKGGIVALMDDIALNDTFLTVSNDTVLNLNGYTLSGVSTSSTTSKLIEVKPGANLTLQNGLVSFAATTPDTQWGGAGQPAFPGYANNTIVCRGNLIVDGATIENLTAKGGASYAIDCYAGANLIVNSGEIKGYDKVAIRMFSGSASPAINATINGGKISGTRAVWLQAAGGNAAVAPDMNLTVNGGALYSTDNKYNLAIYSYSYGNDVSDVDIALNGGVYYGNVAVGASEDTTKVGAEKVTVGEGITVYGDVYRYIEGGTVSILSGNDNVSSAYDKNSLIAAGQTGNNVIIATDIVTEANTETLIEAPAGKPFNVDGNGSTITTNGIGTAAGSSYDYGYVGFIPANKENATVSNVKVVGSGFVEVGHYGTSTGGNYTINNLVIEDLVATLSINNCGNNIAAAFSHYGIATMTDCVMTGTTTKKDGYKPYDAAFVNGTKTTIIGGEYGNVYLANQAHVTVKAGTKIDVIDSYAIVTKNLGELVIESGAKVGTINLYDTGKYKATLTIENGANVDAIVYNGVTYTVAEWLAIQ